MKTNFIFAILFCSFSVFAQPVKIVVPYAPGGVTDRCARTVEKTLSSRLPNNFSIEYQTGAGGIIAANNVAKITAKETVLLVHSAAIAANSSDNNSTYDLLKDFIPVAVIGSVPMVLVTNQQSSITTLRRLKEYDSAMFYATAGHGTAMHVAGERLQKNLNKNITAIPYRGESAAFNDILSNNVTMMFASLSIVAGYANSPQISMLAITGTKRHEELPLVPTFIEQGISGFDKSPNWIVVLANSTADLATISKIKNAIEASFRDPQDQALYLRAGVEINAQPTTNIKEFLAKEIEKVKSLKSKF